MDTVLHDVRVNGHLIAAQRIDPRGVMACGGQRPVIARVPDVIHDELIVWIGFAHEVLFPARSPAINRIPIRP